MQEKQKVTLYLPPELHRQLKIQAAVESEPMSAIAERALSFVLEHPGVIEEYEASQVGATHQVHHCPECASAVVLRSGALVALSPSATIVDDDELQVPTESLVGASV